jgi:phage terminase large subunit-like protein
MIADSSVELLDDVPGALWSRALIDETRWAAYKGIPDLNRIVVAIDPAVSTGEDADETGIVVAGKDVDGYGSSTGTSWPAALHRRTVWRARTT